MTYKEAADVQPFANTLVTLELTAAQIKQVLEEQWQPAGASRPFLKLGINREFTYTYDPTAATNQHVTEMLAQWDQARHGVAHQVPHRRKLVPGLGWRQLLHSCPGHQQGRQRQDRSGRPWSTTSTSSETVSPDLAQRAVGVQILGDGTPTPPGEQVTVDLSSLEFSRNETAAGSVDITFGGQVLATPGG